RVGVGPAGIAVILRLDAHHLLRLIDRTVQLQRVGCPIPTGLRPKGQLLLCPGRHLVKAIRPGPVAEPAVEGLRPLQGRRLRRGGRLRQHSAVRQGHGHLRKLIGAHSQSRAVRRRGAVLQRLQNHRIGQGLGCSLSEGGRARHRAAV
ncbi:50S ribosomal protein L15, partial [Dysosmobacter welbionis]